MDEVNRDRLRRTLEMQNLLEKVRSLPGMEIDCEEICLFREFYSERVAKFLIKN